MVSTRGLVPLLILGVAAFVVWKFWNPSICGTLNGFQKSFDFCNFISTDEAIARDPGSRRIVPAGHTRRHVTHVGSREKTEAFERAHPGSQHPLPPPPTAKASLAEMVDYRMSI